MAVFVTRHPTDTLEKDRVIKCQSIVNNRRNHIAGALIGLAAAQGRDISELSSVIGELEAGIAASIKENPEIFVKKYNRAEERFRFLDT